MRKNDLENLVTIGGIKGMEQDGRKKLTFTDGLLCDMKDSSGAYTNQKG